MKLKSIFAKVICWAVGVRWAEVLTIETERQFLVLSLPWHGMQYRADLSKELTEMTGLDIIVLPQGATLLKLWKVERIEEPKREEPGTV